LLAKIEKYQGATNAAGEADQEAANSLLRTFEEELEFDKDQWAKKLEKKADKATDAQKRNYFDALARYNFVSLELGENSPAKAAARAAAVAAAAEAALRQLTTNIAKADDLQEVMKFVAQASKGTSTLPALLEEARTTDDIRGVLRIVAEDKKLARALSQAILASTTGEEVS